MAKKEKKEKNSNKREQAEQALKGKKVNRRKQLAEAKRYIKANKDRVVRLTNDSGNKQILMPEAREASHHTLDLFRVECTVSIALLVLVLVLFSCYAPPQQVADYVSLIFVVVAHFLASAVIINAIQQQSSGFRFVANIVTSLIYWGASIFVTVLVHAMDMVPVGMVAFAQLVVLGVATIFITAIFSFSKLNASNSEQQDSTAAAQQ